ncbi:TatD family hydrolase [Chloroflexota bacterium]
MNILLVDTHAHLDMSVFDEDRIETITRAWDVGVGHIITVGTDLGSSIKAIELSEHHTGVYAAVGIHPHDVTTIDKADIARLSEIAKHSSVVAIGETGLDFYRDYSSRGAQIQALKWQLALSVELELPAIIHCRQAEEDMLDLLRSWISEYGDTSRQCRGVIHCFSSDSSTAKEYLNMGFYISVGAYIGYPTSAGTHDAIRSIPKDRLLVETDCPFLPPQSYRGRRNEPAYLPFTVKALATIREESYEDIAKVSTQNARRLFRLPLSNITSEICD